MRGCASVLSVLWVGFCTLGVFYTIGEHLVSGYLGPKTVLESLVWVFMASPGVGVFFFLRSQPDGDQ